MGCDMVVALGRATADGATLFGQNTERPAGERVPLHRAAGREFAPGEKVRTQYLDVPQVRRTATILGARPDGWWGYAHGVNEHGLALGTASLRTRLAGAPPGLTGGDLVRLALERCRSARQAVDLITSLVERHGTAPGAAGTRGSDQGFLIADAGEGFAVETAGRYWAAQEVRQVRAAGNVCLIRQDWDRIAHGLAEHAIREGCWPADGSKVDFAGAVAECPTGEFSGLRRWGRATWLLEQQNGSIDLAFLRRILGDHYEGTHFEMDPLLPTSGPVPLCRHAVHPGGRATAASLVAHLPAGADRLPVAWCAFGPPCGSLYFPIFLEAEPPRGLAPAPRAERRGSAEARRDADELAFDTAGRAEAREALARLQAQLDADAEELAVEGAALKAAGAREELERSAGRLMEEHLGQFRQLVRQFGAAPREAAPRVHGVAVRDS